MEYERGSKNLSVDMNFSTGSPNTPATHVAREDCPHLADPEWEALQRLSTVIGEAAVATMLRTFLDLQQGKHGVHAYAQRARCLVSNIVTNPIDEATKVVTFMKGLRDGPVKTYLFREYPGTLEAAITLAMQEAVSLRQAKLQANIPRPIPRPVVEPTGGPEPMDLSRRRQLDPSSVVGQRMFVVSGGKTTVTMPVSAQRLCTWRRADVSILGITTGKQKTKVTSRRAPPAGVAVDRVDIGHAELQTAAPRESHSHCKKKDDKPNVVILKVNSKRESSRRALVDCGASNNFVRLQSLARLDFKEVELPRSLLET
ncbi:unnamed protein product [Phytophthora fragariaefolia]|uniref:Unnamed protein product n=1 Tax=Phytophthora fragariaefolia TaxID=1490495 RepID=A0A9W6Y7S2_9STRA|nr:unnamed protein product [Phytophthora fragariaefolia]